MSLITVELPKSLHMKITELSEAEGISANQFLVLGRCRKNVRHTDRKLSGRGSP